MENFDGISKRIKKDGANNYAMSVIIGLFILGVFGLGRVSYTAMETITNTNIALSKTNSELSKTNSQLSATNISLTATNQLLIDEDVRNMEDIKKTLNNTNNTVLSIEREVRDLNKRIR